MPLVRHLAHLRVLERAEERAVRELRIVAWWSLERCTMPAGTPAACSRSISSRGVVARGERARARGRCSSRCGAPSGCGVERGRPSPTPARRARGAARATARRSRPRSRTTGRRRRTGRRRAARHRARRCRRGAALRPLTCASSSSGARKWSADSICAWSMNCPSPVRRRWSSAAISVGRRGSAARSCRCRR